MRASGGRGLRPAADAERQGGPIPRAAGVQVHRAPTVAQAEVHRALAAREARVGEGTVHGAVALADAEVDRASARAHAGARADKVDQAVSVAVPVGGRGSVAVGHVDGAVPVPEAGPDGDGAVRGTVVGRAREVAEADVAPARAAAVVPGVGGEDRADARAGGAR